MFKSFIRGLLVSLSCAFIGFFAWAALVAVWPAPLSALLMGVGLLALVVGAFGVLAVLFITHVNRDESTMPPALTVGAVSYAAGMALYPLLVQGVSGGWLALWVSPVLAALSVLYYAQETQGR